MQKIKISPYVFLFYLCFSLCAFAQAGQFFQEDNREKRENGENKEDLMKKIWTLQESKKSSDKNEAAHLTQVIIKTLQEDEPIEVSGNSQKGFHESLILKFKYEGKIIRAIFKPENPYKAGTKINSEVAAYVFDQLLNFHLVPITTQRFFRGTMGSIQLMVNARVGKDYLKKGEDIPPMPNKLKIFDYLTKSWDRKINPGNYLFYDDGRVVAIDHGWSFKRFGILNLLAFQPMLKLGSKKHFLKNYEDEDVYEKVSSISSRQIKETLNPYLSKAQIKNLLHRISNYKNKNIIYKTIY